MNNCNTVGKFNYLEFQFETKSLIRIDFTFLMALFFFWIDQENNIYIYIYIFYIDKKNSCTLKERKFIQNYTLILY